MIHASSPEITAFWERACAAQNIDTDATRHVYTFADSSLAPAGLIDEITALACLGKKHGTTHLRHDFEVNAIAMHAVGDYWLALDEDLDPRCLLRITAVVIKPFDRVDARFAASEGEGDLSLAHWRDGHRDYFQRQCEGWGMQWREDLEAVCESFELVHTEP